MTVESVLIISNIGSTMGIISDFMKSENISRIATAQNGAQARRTITDSDFELIVIDTPLPDELGDDLAVTAAEKTTAGVILIVDNGTVFEVGERVEDFGVFALPKPTTSEFFYQAAKLLCASRRRMQNLENENQRLQKTGAKFCSRQRKANTMHLCTRVFAATTGSGVGEGFVSRLASPIPTIPRLSGSSVIFWTNVIATASRSCW